MAISVAAFFDLYRFPTGRRSFAHKQLVARASAPEVAHIRDHAGAARAHDHKTRQLEVARRGSPRASHGALAVKLDNDIDRCLAGIDGYFDTQLRVFPTSHPRNAAAAALKQALFPDGSDAIARLSFVQEHEAINVLLDDARGDALATHVAALPDLPTMLDALAELNQRYGAQLSPSRRGPTADEVRAAQVHGHELLAETVTLILAHYITTRDDATTARLLEPIVIQNEAIRLARRRRRLVLDVDADSGEEQSDDDAPAGTSGGDGDGDGDAGDDGDDTAG